MGIGKDERDLNQFWRKCDKYSGPSQVLWDLTPWSGGGLPGEERRQKLHVVVRSSSCASDQRVPAASGDGGETCTLIFVRNAHFPVPWVGAVPVQSRRRAALRAAVPELCPAKCH